MNCQEARMLFEEAIDHALTGACKRKFDLHLQRCPACRTIYHADVREHAELFRMLNASADGEGLPSRARMVARLRESRSADLSRVPWYRRLPRWAKVAAAVLACLAGVVVAGQVISAIQGRAGDDAGGGTSVQGVEESATSAAGNGAKSMALHALPVLQSQSTPNLQGSDAVPVASDPVRIISGKNTLVWNTVVDGEGRVPSWTWPEGARSAVVQIRRSDGSAATSRVDRVGEEREGRCSLNVACPRTTADESVLDFTLTFYASPGGAGAEVGGRLVAEGVGLVCGTGGGSTDVRMYGPLDARWSTVASRSPVLPVPEGTTAMTLDDEQLALTHTPGWTFVPELGNGTTVMLSMTGALSADATVTCYVPGLVLTFR